MVVMDVNRIGRNRRLPADINASNSGTPDRTRALMKSTSTIESLTTTPVNEIIPKMLNSVTSIPKIP